MTFLRNRNVAKCLSALVVAAAILIGGYSSLSGLREAAEQSFYGGQSSLSADLDDISAQCHNLTTIAKRYMSADDKLIADVLQNRQSMQQARTPREKHAANQKLLESAMVLFDQLGQLPLNEKDAGYHIAWLVEVQDRTAIISHSTYNNDARGFNKKLAAFPANILGALTRVAPLELYE